jgi:hypothetical protein
MLGFGRAGDGGERLSMLALVRVNGSRTKVLDQRAVVRKAARLR